MPFAGERVVGGWIERDERDRGGGGNTRRGGGKGAAARQPSVDDEAGGQRERQEHAVKARVREQREQDRDKRDPRPRPDVDRAEGKRKEDAERVPAADHCELEDEEVSEGEQPSLQRRERPFPGDEGRGNGAAGDMRHGGIDGQCPAWRHRECLEPVTRIEIGCRGMEKEVAAGVGCR